MKIKTTLMASTAALLVLSGAAFAASPMAGETLAADQTFTYQGDIQFKDAGHFGLNIRITPNHPDKECRHAMGLVIWGQV